MCMQPSKHEKVFTENNRVREEEKVNKKPFRLTNALHSRLCCSHTHVLIFDDEREKKYERILNSSQRDVSLARMNE